MSDTEDDKNPLERLSAYEKKLILGMPPSQSERFRMNNARLSKAEREDVLITIIRERRRLYEDNFKLSCKNSGIEAPAVRSVMSEEREKPFRVHMNAALAATNDQRIRDNKHNISHHYAVENQRREKQRLPPLTQAEDEARHTQRNKRKRSMRF